MKTAKQYNEMAQAAAYKIARALSPVDNEPDDVRQRLEQIIMQRVSLMREGSQMVIEGDHLVKEKVEPAPAPKEEPAGSTEDPPSP